MKAPIFSGSAFRYSAKSFTVAEFCRAVRSVSDCSRFVSMVPRESDVVESEVSEGQRVAELPQNGPRLGERGSEPAQGPFQGAAGFHQGIQAGRDVWQHAVLEGGRGGANSFRG